MSKSPNRAAVVQAARAMAIDQVTAEVVKALTRSGIHPILLKGPAIACWLYPDGGRSYVDTDLLVDPDAFNAAEAVLVGLGFGADSRLRKWEPACSYYRSVPGTGYRFSVDLHRSLRHVQASPATVWIALSADTTGMTVAGTEVAVLSVPARLAHIALHATQHGGAPQQLEDLRRALATVEADQWVQALEVARSLGAEDCLSAALRLLPLGRQLAGELALSDDLRPAVRLTFTNSGAQGLQQLADAASHRDRASVVHDVLFPPAATMRRLSPLACRGPAGLGLAYVVRPVRLLLRLAPALRIWRRSRMLGDLREKRPVT